MENCKLDLAGHIIVDGGREVQPTRCETVLLAAFVGIPCRLLSRSKLMPGSRRSAGWKKIADACRITVSERPGPRE
jgi:hypothetical protein